MADFGIASEATSRTLHTSNNLKGSSGYRAPELVEFEGPGMYNNKVDIWSLGCILYELVIGKRAFNDDVVTHTYKKSGEMTIVLGEDIDDNYKKSITRNILNMLQLNYSLRPSAVDLLQEFSSNFESIRIESPDAVQIHETLPDIL